MGGLPNAAATVVVAVVVVVAVLEVIGRVRLARRRPGAVTGDAALTAAIARLDLDRFPRLAMVVVEHDRPTRSAFRRCDAGTPWEVGSVTKALTGLLVADAVRRGEVTLPSRLADLDASYADTAVGSSTVAELVTHTTGLPAVGVDHWSAARALGYLTVGPSPYLGCGVTGVRRAAAGARLADRGTSRYANLGAAVLGHALAHRAGTDYPTLVRRRLLDPLGMPATTVDRTAGPRLPRGWRTHGRRAWPWADAGHAPAGGVVSTVADLVVLPDSRRAVAVVADLADPGRLEQLAVAGLRALDAVGD